VGKKNKGKEREGRGKRSINKTLAYVFSCFLQSYPFDHVVGKKKPNKAQTEGKKLKGNRLKEAF